MRHASLALARRVDLAEAAFCALAARAGHPGGARQLVVGGGHALCGPPGSPFNKMLGLGLGQDVSDADLDAIDAFYDEAAEPAQIELCPLTSQLLPSRLAARGYVLRGFENQLAWQIGPVVADLVPTQRVDVTPVVSPADDESWVQVVSAGFAAGEGVGAAVDDSVIGSIASMMRAFQHETMTKYLASVEGQLVGGGAVFVVDGIAGLTGTATVPSSRGRGVQHAVVARMLRELEGRADLAMATTEPGSRSQRTFERFGFEVIYTRSVWIRPFGAA